MTKCELLDKCINSDINEETISEIESIYKVHMSEEAKRVFSCLLDDCFCDGWRVLSKEEILISNKWMNQDYIRNGIVPFIDIYDLNYIVYIPNENVWAMVNDGDGIIFNRKKSLKEFIEE